MIPRQEYGHDYPEIEGLSEIHIFLAPLNPDQDTLNKYHAAVEEYNQSELKDTVNKMKGVFLCLNFRTLGDVNVMQSSRYIHSNSTNEVINEAYKDGEWFKNHGFTLLRHKIECVASAKNVPLTQIESEQFNNRYFEFHIRVRRKNTEGSDEAELVITDNEIDLLKQISFNFTKKYKTPVPLSFNQSNRGQRYLNVRFANCGSEVARQRANEVKEAIEQSNELTWVKTISEYVWYDDFRQLDSGWIDFTDDEKRNLLEIY